MTRRQMKLAAMAMVLGLAPAGAAFAEGEGFYFGISGGVAMFDLPSKSAFDELLGGIPAQSSLDDTGDAWGLQVGYRWNRYVAAEIGYVNFGQADYEADLTGTTERFSVRFKSSGPTVSVLGMLPLGERFDLHGRAGIYFADTRVRTRVEDFQTGDFDSIQATADSRDLFLGIGGAWNINESYSLRVEYQRFLDVGDEDHTDEEDVDLLTFGVLFR